MRRNVTEGAKHTRITAKDYAAYRLHVRRGNKEHGNRLMLYRRLFEELCVDCADVAASLLLSSMETIAVTKQTATIQSLTEPAAPSSESRSQGRKAHANRALLSKKRQQAPQQQEADDCAEASEDDSDGEVIADVTPDTQEAYDDLTNSSFASGHAGARRLAPTSPHTSSTPRQIAQSAPSHDVAQRQSHNIRLETLSIRALADWKRQMSCHCARVHIQGQPRLLGIVVSHYTAHEDCGAYTAWLLCPSKANRWLRMAQ
ncbi:hypothetical protein WJX79_006722 [Trebouxia sp. C0005]